MDTWVANNSSVLTVPLIMPESFYFASAMSDPTLNDANAVNRVGIVGGHIYGAAPFYYTLAKSLNKDVWMTEHTVNLASGETTTQSIADAIAAAEEIHTSLTVGQYNAYVYWWLVNSAGSSYYSGLLDTNGKATFFGDALAQYSLFVRPGYVRTSATASPLTGVFVSAYSGNGHQVIVAINSNATAATIPFTIQNATVSSLTPYQTTATQSVAEQTVISVTGNAFSYNLPAQSITTFVQQGTGRLRASQRRADSEASESALFIWLLGWGVLSGAVSVQLLHVLGAHIVCRKQAQERCSLSGSFHSGTPVGLLALDDADDGRNHHAGLAGGFKGHQGRRSGGANIVHNHHARTFAIEAFQAAAGAVGFFSLADQETVQQGSGGIPLRPPRTGRGNVGHNGVCAERESAHRFGVDLVGFEQLKNGFAGQASAFGMESGRPAIDVVIAGPARGKLELAKAEAGAGEQREQLLGVRWGGHHCLL
jgi:hypothetical protein